MGLNLTISEENNSQDAEKIVLISIDDIDDENRLRAPNLEVSAALAQSIERSGQLHPIDVCQLPNLKSGKPYKLVCGGHRLEAHRILGRPKIAAIIRSSEVDARNERQIVENIFKNELSPLDRAKFVGELVAIEKRRSGFEDGDNILQIAATSRWNHEGKAASKDASETISKAFKFSERVAEKLGLTDRTIRSDLALLRISSKVLDALKTLGLADNGKALRAAAKLNSDNCDAFADDLLAGVSLPDCISKHVQGRAAIITDEQAKEVKFVKEFSKLPSHIQDAILSQISPMVSQRWTLSLKRKNK